MPNNIIRNAGYIVVLRTSLIIIEVYIFYANNKQTFQLPVRACVLILFADMAKVVFEGATDDNKTDDSEPTAIVAGFSNGRLKLDQNDVGFGYFCNSGAKWTSCRQKMLVAETEQARYVGRNFGPDAISSPTLCRYMLGVYDKQTNKVRLVDATMFHLRPSTEDSDIEDNSNEPERKDEDELTFVQKHARLTEEFGTAKGKRMVEARMRNKVKSQALESVIASAMKDSAAVSSSAGQSERECPAGIPPHNREATQAEDVYLLDDIISPAEMVALMGPATVFVNATFENINEWREKGTYPGYVMHQLSILPTQGSMREHRSAILLYWAYLHQLLHECNKQTTHDSSLLSDVPAVIRRSLSDRFTQVFGGKHGKSVRKMPARKKDLLRSYMLVLCLILEEFSLDFTALQRDLDVSLPQLEKCFKALGCKTSRQTSKAATGQTSKSFKATLVVPLTFPAYKARAGRR